VIDRIIKPISDSLTSASQLSQFIHTSKVRLDLSRPFAYAAAASSKIAAISNY
jgi:hypothetical protein